MSNFPGVSRSWRAFCQAYPTFFKLAAVMVLGLVVLNIWLAHRRSAYAQEIEQLRGQMSQAERAKTDMIIKSEEDQLQMAVELARRQVRWDPQLHLSIAVDSGRMYLARHGAVLRTMQVSIGPEILPGADTPVSTRLRGERTIEEVIREDGTQFVLTGGVRIYAGSDTTQVAPGAVRMSPADMKAILGNISPGMVVYFY
jgi:hypothetical protein